MDAHQNKLAYRSPRLTAFGDVRQLTRLSGQKNGTTDRFTKKVGMGGCQETLKTGTGEDINCIP